MHNLKAKKRNRNGKVRGWEFTSRNESPRIVRRNGKLGAEIGDDGLDGRNAPWRLVFPSYAVQSREMWPYPERKM